ncbi:MAG: hypothetical protein JST31_15690, partial [Actinobacteria bacterium]|nr:hypothetical protein [Actinomycetota bacterium]
REEFRQIISDVNKLPETQRSALLLREMDALSYEEIATAMETTVPSVKSLLVRARISLAEASQARLLTCGEVRVELSEAAEGLRKVSPPVRRHIRECDECADFRSQVRTTEKALAALFPVGPLIAFKGFIASKLGLGGAGASATGAGAAGAGAAGVGSGVSAAIGGSGAAGGIGAIGGAIGTKAVAGVVTAAVLTAGAVEVKQQTSTPVAPAAPPPAKVVNMTNEPGGVEPQATVAVSAAHEPMVASNAQVAPAVKAQLPPTDAEPVAAVETPAVPTPAEEEAAAVGAAETEEAAGSVADGTGGTTAPAGVTLATPSTGTAAGAHPGTGTVVVTVTTPTGSTGTSTTPPPTTTAPPPAPTAAPTTPPAPPVDEAAPPAEEQQPAVAAGAEDPGPEATP